VIVDVCGLAAVAMGVSSSARGLVLPRSRASATPSFRKGFLHTVMMMVVVVVVVVVVVMAL
jgi:hypothetical protein